MAESFPPNYTPPVVTPPAEAPLTGVDAAVGEAQNVIDNYSFVTGGPNQSLINSLNQQSKQKASQYKQNRADASNMYGQLTQTVDKGAKEVQQSYAQNIKQSSASATGAASALGNLLQQQVAQRQKAANELGMAPELAGINYESDTRGNAAIGNILGTQQNWEGLLRAQQSLAKQQGVDTKTALGQSKNMTLLALKQALQQGQGNIANQIATERGKQGSQQMTPLGNILLGGIGSKIQGLMNPTNSGAETLTTGLNSFETNPTLIDAMGGTKPSQFVNPDTGETGPNAFYNFYLNKLQQAYSDDKWKAGAPLAPELDRFAVVFKLPRTMITNASGVFGTTGTSGTY
jgi:hypothetical protein